MNKEIIKNNFSRYAQYYDKYSSIQNRCALKLINKVNPVRERSSLSSLEKEFLTEQMVVAYGGISTSGGEGGFAAKEKLQSASMGDNCLDNVGAAFSNRVNENGFKNILEVGCGTGEYTKLLREKFPFAAIKALDISGEMVSVAKEKLKDKNIEFVVADGETVDFKEEFDLITSNVAFQWFDNLKDTLFQYKRLLSENGMVLFSVFGPNTFYELDKCLKILLGSGLAVSSSNFLQKFKLEDILKDVFEDMEVEEKLYQETHSSLSELLMKIKYTGTRGNGLGEKKFLVPRVVDKLENLYKKEFFNITATYQVFFCKGRKSDDLT